MEEMTFMRHPDAPRPPTPTLTAVLKDTLAELDTHHTEVEREQVRLREEQEMFDFDREVFTEQFDEYLGEEYGSMSIGNLQFTPSEVLQALAPDDYDAGFRDWTRDADLDGIDDDYDRLLERLDAAFATEQRLRSLTSAIRLKVEAMLREIEAARKSYQQWTEGEDE